MNMGRVTYRLYWFIQEAGYALPLCGHRPNFSVSWKFDSALGIKKTVRDYTTPIIV